MQYLKTEVMEPFIFPFWLFIPEMPAIVLQGGIQALTFVITQVDRQSHAGKYIIVLLHRSWVWLYGLGGFFAGIPPIIFRIAS